MQAIEYTNNLNKLIKEFFNKCVESENHELTGATLADVVMKPCINNDEVYYHLLLETNKCEHMADCYYYADQPFKVENYRFYE